MTKKELIEALDPYPDNVRLVFESPEGGMWFANKVEPRRCRPHPESGPYWTGPQWELVPIDDKGASDQVACLL